MKEYITPATEIIEMYTTHDTMVVEGSLKVNEFKGTQDIDLGGDEDDEANSMSTDLWDEE